MGSWSGDRHLWRQEIMARGIIKHLKRMYAPKHWMLDKLRRAGHVGRVQICSKKWWWDDPCLHGCTRVQQGGNWMGSARGRWAPKPNAGPHKLRECLPLIVTRTVYGKIWKDRKQTWQMHGLHDARQGYTVSLNWWDNWCVYGCLWFVSFTSVLSCLPTTNFLHWDIPYSILSWLTTWQVALGFLKHSNTVPHYLSEIHFELHP